MAQATTTRAGDSLLLASFYVRGALCALDAAEVQEVIRLSAVTPVRHAAEEVLGIINLRGRIVTVLDIGLRLGFSSAQPTPESRVFIVEDGGEYIGLLVDRVSEVVEVDGRLLEAAPSNVSSRQSRYFKGVYSAGQHVVAVIDIHPLLAGDAL
jgi:purine-binding chemotaxis protein CheW